MSDEAEVMRFASHMSIPVENVDRPKDWEATRTKTEGLGAEWIFRGVADSEWHLWPRLTRALRRSGAQYDVFWEQEASAIRYFKGGVKGS